MSSRGCWGPSCLRRSLWLSTEGPGGRDLCGGCGSHDSRAGAGRGGEWYPDLGVSGAWPRAGVGSELDGGLPKAAQLVTGPGRALHLTLVGQALEHFPHPASLSGLQAGRKGLSDSDVVSPPLAW